jgi:putative N6-adenine-specific DNA methylase
VGKDDAFPVKGHSVKSALFSIPDCQSIVKKAAVKRLSDKYGISWFRETGVKYQIEFFILKDEVFMMIDTSGTALHKRGYRPQTLAAPLRETLAAALAKTARPREDVLFWDPFCGSATIPIEASLIMTNTAPGLFRGFAAEGFAKIPEGTWKEAREEARSLINHESKFEAYASDISEEALKNARSAISKAGMNAHIKLFNKNALEISTEGRRGTVVCNPPYGERLGTIEETEKLYRDMGRHFKTLDNWQIYVITSHEKFERLYGRKADKVRKLYNGMIPCYYYQFFRKDNKK